VPKISVHEHGESRLSEGEVGCAENLSVVALEAEAKSFQCHRKPLFRLGFGSPNRPHDAATRFLVEYIGHVRAGPSQSNNIRSASRVCATCEKRTMPRAQSPERLAVSGSPIELTSPRHL
jgi:hypothetical protein